VEVGKTEAEAEAMVLIEIVMIHFILVLIISVLSLMETTTMGTIEVTTLVEVVTRINRAHTRHELLTKLRQWTRDMMALMVGWEELAQLTTTVAMGVMVEIPLPTPGAAMLLQTSTVLVMITGQHLVQTTTTRIGMEKVVVTVDMVGMEGMARLPIPLVIHREVVL
jgi:hypothetical protein